MLLFWCYAATPCSLTRRHPSWERSYAARSRAIEGFRQFCLIIDGATMIPVGYMAKRVSTRPEWIQSERVVDVYSVSNCVSHDFADYIKYWKHNGFWFFDSPEIIRQLAQENSVDLKGTRLFYYEVHELEFDEAEGQSEVETNQHCLMASLEQAQQLLENGKFKNAEPGPYRIFAVYSSGWP